MNIKDLTPLGACPLCGGRLETVSFEASGGPYRYSTCEAQFTCLERRCGAKMRVHGTHYEPEMLSRAMAWARGAVERDRLGVGGLQFVD